MHLFAVADALDALVFKATRANVDDRLSSAEEFLDLLDEAERAGVVPDSPAALAVDPLEALPGHALDAEWSVRRVLGTGATARALLVERVVEDDGGTIRVEPRVFKVALDEQKADRLRAEERALKLVGGGAVVQLRGEGLREIGPRTVLQLEYAGEQSLGARLRGKGQLTYDELEDFGEDLFLALDQLAANGVRHRDIKPDNLGIHRRKDFTWQLKLFDFSLTDASDRDVKAGTRGYLDPFLGSVRRPHFDDHAERYAAAVTLHEMASGERPLWGDGRTDPLTNESAELHIAGELFHRPLAVGPDRLLPARPAPRHRAPLRHPAADEGRLAEGVPGRRQRPAADDPVHRGFRGGGRGAGTGPRSPGRRRGDGAGTRGPVATRGHGRRGPRRHNGRAAAGDPAVGHPQDPRRPSAGPQGAEPPSRSVGGGTAREVRRGCRAQVRRLREGGTRKRASPASCRSTTWQGC
ncbi:protein kinase domain-containing protein [Streptomyces caniscabiei]|uniref:protein kinase domain-containing protein n=1 Tax=Streptomyces caniscabiei TaxID=2746961 RepID=UPI0029A3BED3|nr:hypothetical protein [Streptomyces caniscabiei]MDX3731456.1 hypothetical protein [Streptomyces caniscabiei]